MWLLAVVFAAISMPWFRSFLEVVFAELVVIFFNSMMQVISICCVVLLWGLFREWKAMTSSPKKRNDDIEVTSKCSSSSFALSSSITKKKATSALLFIAAVLPIGNVFAQEAKEAIAGGASIGSNKTAMAQIEPLLSQCTYSKKKECVKNPQKVSAFGNYQRGPGMCATLDGAYIPLSMPTAALPSQYKPINAKEASKNGFNNKFSEWTAKNKEQFQVDCPILYNETVKQGQDFLCCTETQYEGLQKQVRMIPGLCTSCKENLRNIWCQFTCHPSNSMFMDVNEVRIMPGDESHKEQTYAANEHITYYIGKDFARDVYDFCEKDSSFPIMCNPNQNCTDGLGLLKFMGAYKFNSLGSPIQVDFKTIDNFSKTEQKEKICSCEKGNNATSCIKPMDSRLRSCAGVCGSLCSVKPNDKRSYQPACYGAQSLSGGNSTGGNSNEFQDTKWSEFMQFMADGIVESDFSSLNMALVIIGVTLAVALIGSFAYAIRKDKKKKAYGEFAEEENVAGASPRPLRLSFVDDFMTKLMTKWSLFLSSGNRPYLVIFLSLVVVVASAIGLSKVEVETDPVKLWVAENSRSYTERDRFGALFMPFYRTEQIILVPKDGGSIGRREYIKEALRVQEKVAAITYGPVGAAFPNRVTLEDICWKATGTQCTVNSITQYFQNSLEHFNFYDKYGLAMEHFSNCLYSPENSDLATCGTIRAKLKPGDKIPATMSDCPCLAAFGAPMNLYNTYLGGFPAGAATNTTKYLESTAFVSTALVYNYYEAELNMPAIKWEREFIESMKEESAANKMFNIYFMGETSIQDEIEHESTGDILPVALSYSLMIVYVTLGINRWKFSKSFFITAKFTVGFLGIFCIILSVATTIGLFMWFGAKLQLIIMEVVPFLTLAIGVDNIFLIVHAIDEVQHKLLAENPDRFAGDMDKEAINALVSKIVSEALGHIGPSICMASFAESVAFAFGCISPMPAVLWFAAFSSVAVAVNLLLQMSLFLSILVLDKRREMSGKYDVLCCVRSRDGAFDAPNARNQRRGSIPSMPSGPWTPVNTINEDDLNSKAEHLFDTFVTAYAKFLANKIVKLVVLLVFLVWTLWSIFSVENLKHGLPQAESMPSESYMVSYFNALDEYLETGPPIYFVVESGYNGNPAVFDFSDKKLEAMLCKSKEFCNEYSIPKIVDALGNNGDSKITHFSKGVTYSWMDDFWGFVNPDSECCRLDGKNAYLPIISSNQAYMTVRGSGKSCMASAPPPVPEKSFMSLFGMFATASAGPMCSYGGGSIYRGQFSIDDKPIPVVKKDTPPVVLNSTTNGKEVTAFSYMIVSSANPTQQDYIDSYKQSRRAAEWISKKSGLNVWPYSISFVFFDQYLTIIEDTWMLVGLAIAAIFVIHCIYFWGFFYPIVVAVMTINIVVEVMGLMQPLDILLNGLSLVNLIIAAGVSVEFCSHFARIFAKTSGSGDQRAREALRRVFMSVFFGITITKCVGLSALTLADSRIFQKYYFRMYMAIVLCGFLNGMVLLPVLLSVLVDVKQYFFKPKSTEESDNLAANSPLYRDGPNGMVKLSSTSNSVSFSKANE